tara:strand:- start:482 stop:907 length:426 start_codon:yes stop_codon:yes gene_type:complete
MAVTPAAAVAINALRQAMDDMRTAGHTKDVPDLTNLNSRGMQSTRKMIRELRLSGVDHFVNLAGELAAISTAAEASRRTAKLAIYLLIMGPNNAKPIEWQMLHEDQELYTGRREALEQLRNRIGVVRNAHQMTVIDIATQL